MKIYSAHHSHKYRIVILFPVLVGLLFVQLTKAETWAIVSSGTTNNIKGVTWDGSRFVAVDSEGGVLESAYGTSWSRRQTQSYGFSEIVTGGGRYIAIQEYDQACYESSDRITWNERDTSQLNDLLGGTYNTGQFVLVGEKGTILKSSNGINWNTVTTSPTDKDINKIIYGVGLNVAVGDAGIFTTANTIDWTLRARGPIYGFSDVAFYGGRFVAVTYIDSQIFTSTTGMSWSGVEIDSLNNTFPNLPPWGNAVCGGPSGFKVVCDSGKAFTSINGKDCQSINMQTTSNINDVTYGGGAYVAVGNNGLIRVLLNTVPEIAVEQPVATNITDGSFKTFDSVAIGASASLTFTIKNIGTANLTGLILSKDGTNPSDFTITSNPVAPVAGPSGSTTFIVRFAPTASGTRSATIHIASNDADENPFNLTLTGTGVVPFVTVALMSSSALEDGTSNLIYTFARTGVTTGALTASFTVGGTATYGIDYTQTGSANYSTSSGTVTFLAGSSTAVVTLDTFTDNIVEAHETVILTVTSGMGYSVGSPSAANGTITNDDTPLSSWRQTYFDNTANSGDGADLNDFDEDGIVNLIEFAFGLNPKQSSVGLLPKPQQIAGNLVVSFTQPSGVSGVTYGAKWSQTLASESWISVVDSGSSPQHTFSVPMGIKLKCFIRLVVTIP